jgi:hypothetical protein
MAKEKDIRPIIKMRSTAGTGYTYVTKKNRRSSLGTTEFIRVWSATSSETLDAAKMF